MMLKSSAKDTSFGWMYAFPLSALLLLILVGCTSQQKASSVRVDVDARRPAKTMSEYNLFTLNPTYGSTGTAEPNLPLLPNEGVIPYTVNNSHFVDYAQSRYYLYLPPKTQANYRENDTFEFPVGTVLVQMLTFQNDLGDTSKGEQLIEIRLLIHQTKGWVAVPYLWDLEKADARRAVVGARTPVRWIDDDGQVREHDFTTPNMNQCKQCHKNRDRVQPIGTKARYLNHTSGQGGKNQLTYWTEIGYLSGLPEDLNSVPKSPVWNKRGTGSIKERTRIWLDVNCAPCHNPEGSAIMSGLDLSVHQVTPVKFGVYKPPIAAGLGSGGYRFSIEPGTSQNSFLLFRIRSTDPSIMMPPIGRGLVDKEGATLVSQWIDQIPSDEELEHRALNPMEAYRESLAGGNAKQGKKLFSSKLQCITCHITDESKSGTIGPSLADVGARESREYLLESIVSPSKKIVEGYKTTILTLKNGMILSGTLVSEDSYEVTLATPDGESITVRKEDLKSLRQSTLSMMPSMANLLTIEEARDLVEYLSSLKGIR